MVMVVVEMAVIMMMMMMMLMMVMVVMVGGLNALIDEMVSSTWEALDKTCNLWVP